MPSQPAKPGTISPAPFAAWILGGVICLLAIIAWGDDLGWKFTPLSIYVIFPLLGLVAYGLMWTMYVLGFANEIFKLNRSIFDNYLRAASWAVLALICLHPGLLVYQRFHDGFGLPPGSYESYVAPGLGWVTLLGTASLLVFLAYEFRRVFGNRSWWKYVLITVDAAMVAIFYHGLRLGSNTAHGWFHVLWIFYGITLVAILIRTYALKVRLYLAKKN